MSLISNNEKSACSGWLLVRLTIIGTNTGQLTIQIQKGVEKYFVDCYLTRYQFSKIIALESRPNNLFHRLFYNHNRSIFRQTHTESAKARRYVFDEQ